jgi:hypothetical protein
MLCVLALVAPAAGGEGPERTIGANKFDLALQYLGRASGGDGSSAYRQVTRAMARKAIRDARFAGIRYFRVAVMGYAPSTHGSQGDLSSWLSDRETYWGALDQMMTDLKESGIGLIPSFLWNLRQLPAIAGETVRDLVVKPRSRSRQLLDAYLGEFVVRYRDRGVILFYEVGNELNLSADLDLVGRCRSKWKPAECGAYGNFTTDEMIAFMRSVAERIRSLDPAARVSSGHSFPRPSASHLRRSPEFGTKGADWGLDTMEETADYLAATHAGMDIVSVHIYEEHPLPAYLEGGHVALIDFSMELAQRLGKELFIGEFGGPSRDGLSPGSFVARALERVELLRVPWAALWVWELYPRNPYRTFDAQPSLYNIEPGFSDQLIERIARINGAAARSHAEIGDLVAPTVILVWPLECARVSAPFIAHLAASDDAGVPPRVFVRDGDRIWFAGRRPPYSVRIDDGPAGERELVAIAEDATGNRAMWTTAVVVGQPSGPVRPCARCCTTP